MTTAKLPALGLVGAGAIGSAIAAAVADGRLPYSLACVSDPSAAAVAKLAARTGLSPAHVDIAALCHDSHVVVECAAAAAVPDVIAAARAVHADHGTPTDVVVLSVGGLLQVEAFTDGPVVHVPSGAIGGLDAVQALAVAGIEEIVLTTRKPPAGLGMDVDVETMLFEGSARDVIAQYPKNVNVAVALSFAGVGPDRTRCRLIADPAIDRNTHHIYARGPAGEIEFTSRNLPFPENPATSYLAALSAISLLARLQSTLQVG